MEVSGDADTRELSMAIRKSVFYERDLLDVSACCVLWLALCLGLALISR
jgi:hypothetical protein